MIDPSRTAWRSSCGIATAIALFTSSLSFLTAGCGGSSSSGSSGSGSPASGSGTLSVAMSDAPPAGAPAVTRVNVTIDRVEANVNGAWTPVAAASQSFNLLDLVTNPALLGSTTLPAGHYTQVRLFPSSATVTDTTGTYPVDIPSGVQTGVKLNVDYDINPNQITTILLDFNVNKSLVREGNGQYKLQPVIPAVVKVLSGTVSGTVTDATSGSPLVGATVTAAYTAGSAYALGTDVNTGVSISPDGAFHIWALLPGTYTLTATYTDPGTGAVRTSARTGVIVAANQDTAVGALALP